MFKRVIKGYRMDRVLLAKPAAEPETVAHNQDNVSLKLRARVSPHMENWSRFLEDLLPLLRHLAARQLACTHHAWNNFSSGGNLPVIQKPGP